MQSDDLHYHDYLNFWGITIPDVLPSSNICSLSALPAGIYSALFHTLYNLHTILIRLSGTVPGQYKILHNSAKQIHILFKECERAHVHTHRSLHLSTCLYFVTQKSLQLQIDCIIQLYLILHSSHSLKHFNQYITD